MKVTFYHSPLCPRCLLAKKHLYSVQKEYTNLEIEEVDVVLQYKRALADQVRLFPALHCGQKKLSGIALSRKKISKFLQTLNPE